jgi:hypothetical protein
LAVFPAPDAGKNNVMTTIADCMMRIYHAASCRATGKLLMAVLVLTRAASADNPRVIYWSQPQHIVAGADFLALGYPRGVEVWSWQTGQALEGRSRLFGDSVTAMCAEAGRIFWAAEDATVRAALYESGGLNEIWNARTRAVATGLSASPEYVAALDTDSSVRFWQQSDLNLPPFEWDAPGRLSVVALRDSTLAASGAAWVWLARVRPDTVFVLDSVGISFFAQAMAWARDTLAMAFGAVGLKMAVTESDAFVDTVVIFSDGGLYNELAVWESGWSALDAFGGIVMYKRGAPLVPVARMQSDGTSRGLSARSGEMAVLTHELGVGIVNVFNPQAPYWTAQHRIPGFVRALDYSSIGMLAHADFAGVVALDSNDATWIMSNPYNATDLDLEGNLVAATSLLTGAALFRLDGDTVQEEVSRVPIEGFSSAAELNSGQLYTLRTASCDRGFEVYDVSAPESPAFVTSWSFCVPVRDLEKISGGLAMAVGDSGIWVYATPITDSVLPVAKGGPPRRWERLVWRDGYLWSRAQGGVVARWSWDGSTLFKVDTFHIPRLIWFDVAGVKLAAACSSKTVQIYRWQTGGDLELIESYETANDPRSVAIVADTVWIVDRDAVLRAVVGQSVGVDDNDDAVLPRHAMLGACYPNPFNGAVRIPLDLKPGDWNVTVYNVLGQAIQSWTGRVVTTERKSILWAPSGPGGTPAASGVYLIRARNRGSVEMQKVLYLK